VAGPSSVLTNLKNQQYNIMALPLAAITIGIVKMVEFMCNGVQVSDELCAAGYMCEADVDDSDTMNKKIRNAQLAQYNFILGTCC